MFAKNGEAEALQPHSGQKEMWSPYLWHWWQLTTADRQIKGIKTVLENCGKVNAIMVSTETN